MLVKLSMWVGPVRDGLLEVVSSSFVDQASSVENHGSEHSEEQQQKSVCLVHCGTDARLSRETSQEYTYVPVYHHGRTSGLRMTSAPPPTPRRYLNHLPRTCLCLRRIRVSCFSNALGCTMQALQGQAQLVTLLLSMPSRVPRCVGAIGATCSSTSSRVVARCGSESCGGEQSTIRMCRGVR